MKQLIVSEGLTPYMTNSNFMLMNLDAKLMHKIKQVCHFSSLSMFCLGCKTISRRAARRLIVLHPKQNIESQLKWQTCFYTMPI